jgi:serine/threonine-protein kinase
MKSQPAKSCPSCGERYGADVLFCPRDGTPLASSLHPPVQPERDPYLGMELAGQIRLQHLIGVGSMGRVYRAFQAGIDRHVAVKILHRELSANPELVARFHREAKIASRLVHPNVVQVLMTGCLPLTADPRIGGELYLVMEHLDGISLLSALAAAETGEAGAALPLARALHLALQLCDAVGEAHAQGIVHRDLKPENIMLVRRGEDPDYVKVLDFGIARLDWGDRSMATQAGLIFGTAKYISPEGAEGQPVGPPADVYAIATILYQCLAGRPPFEGDSPVALLVQHAQAAPPELRGVPRASYVPGPIAAVVMQALAKRAEDRPDDARALGRELVAAARASGLDPEPIVSSSSLLFRSVKLASRERTKALELTPELASKIGGAPPDPPPPLDELGDPTHAGDWPALDPAVAPPAESLRTMPGEPAFLAPEEPAPPKATLVETDAPAPAPSHPRSLGTAPRPPSSSAGATPPPVSAASLDFSDNLPDPPRVASLPSSMQGAELPASTRDVEKPAPRLRVGRIVAIAACAAALSMAVAVGQKHLTRTAASAPDESVEAYLDMARDCIQRRAWDAPPERNLRDVTRDALARFPRDARVLEVRREAAERIVAEALGHKYEGRGDDALRLARLAVDLHPDLTAAQRLVAELERLLPPPPAEADAASSASSARAGQRKPPRDVTSARPPASSLPPTGGPRPAASAASPGARSPELPPSPPPLPADPSPGPSASGPWL